jgi:hypothetical protein
MTSFTRYVQHAAKEPTRQLRQSPHTQRFSFIKLATLFARHDIARFLAHADFNFRARN